MPFVDPILADLTQRRSDQLAQRQALMQSYRQDLMRRQMMDMQQQYKLQAMQQSPAAGRLQLMQQTAQQRQAGWKSAADNYGQLAAGQSDPKKRDAYLSAANMAMAGESPAAVNAYLKSAGVAADSGKITMHWTNEADPTTGVPIVVRHNMDAAGNELSRTVEGYGKLDSRQIAQLQAVNSADRLARGLADDYQRIAPKYAKNGADWLAKQWMLYSVHTNPGGFRGEPDPDAANWFSHVGQIKTDLLQAAAGNSRNLKMIDKLFGLHVPSEWQSPPGVMTRIRAFQNEGRFDSIRHTILPPINVGSTPGAGDGMGSAASLPPSASLLSGGPTRSPKPKRRPVIVGGTWVGGRLIGGKMVGYATEEEKAAGHMYSHP